MKKIAVALCLSLATLGAVSATLLVATDAMAAPPSKKADIRQQFVNFGDQIIDGQIRKPVGTWTQSDQRASFGRMLTWKKRSFFPAMFKDGQQIR